MRVAVIGAGIVGASCALELLRDGHNVTIVEPGRPGGQQSASYGHGCWISPASVVPMSMPGLWRQVPRYLLNPRGPLVIRWRHVLGLMPWLVRFLAAGATVPKVERTAADLAVLMKDSPERHHELAAEIGCPELIRNDGLLYVYPDQAALKADDLAWRLRRMTGLRWSVLDRAALSQREPALAERYHIGLLVERGSHCIDPATYVEHLVSTAIRRGARLVQATCASIIFEGQRCVAIKTDEGDTITCDRVVVAAGIWSKHLAKQSGDRIPLESERGYHAEVEGTTNGPIHPVMPSDGRMANTPTARGLRLSGQVELARVYAPANWQRLDILVDHARNTYPSLNIPVDAAVHRWMGHRPSTPDGRPVIGPSSRSQDVFYAFGHGHIGFASGPATGRIIADLVSGTKPASTFAAFSAGRFKWWK